MAENNRMTFWGFFKRLIFTVLGFVLTLQAVVTLVILLVIMTLMTSVMMDLGDNGAATRTASVPKGAALVINPMGVLVEQAADEDAFQAALEEAYGQSSPSEIEVHDLVAAIKAGAADENISALVLDLGGLQVPSVYASKMQMIVQQIEAFKQSGKKVYAIGDYYSQEQYYLASHADEIMMHHYGSIFMYGFGRYRIYYHELLEKWLDVTTHIFRVGTYKSALEPIMRSDMSEEAKNANLAYLNVLWDDYTSTVEAARGMQDGQIESYADNMLDYIEQADGDLAQAAVVAGLVDELKTRKEQLDYLKEIVGADGNGESFKRVGYRTYLFSVNRNHDGAAPNIAVVTAAGPIVDGDAINGVAAGDRVASYLKQAREDKNVKAVVLRVDSGGGSAFASEVMRTEILALQEAGKPVVASFGSVAASGGYWIAANADEIWAAPTTVTGSIGIFGSVQTFENTLAKAGVYTDGVGTSDMSGLMGAGLGPLPEEFSQIMQASIENGYERFLKIVGEARGLSREEVNERAQGRVWIGEKALDLQLVDKLGYLNDAAASAAALAGIEGDFDVVNIESNLTPFEMFLESLATASVRNGLIKLDDPLFAGRAALLQQASFTKLFEAAADEAAFLDTFNDPNALYMRCMECEPK